MINWRIKNDVRVLSARADGGAPVERLARNR